MGKKNLVKIRYGNILMTSWKFYIKQIRNKLHSPNWLLFQDEEDGKKSLADKRRSEILFSMFCIHFSMENDILWLETGLEFLQTEIRIFAGQPPTCLFLTNK